MARARRVDDRRRERRGERRGREGEEKGGIARGMKKVR
jgi:hypothetical protein